MHFAPELQAQVMQHDSSLDPSQLSGAVDETANCLFKQLLLIDMEDWKIFQPKSNPNKQDLCKSAKGVSHSSLASHLKRDPEASN